MIFEIHALRTVDLTVCHLVQEDSKLDGMVQKLEGAVQQLDSPCHFTVRLIMDDSALTAILATLKLGEIRTGEHGAEASGRPAATCSSAASQLPVNGVGYHSGRSTPDRPASAAAALPSSSSSPALFGSSSPCPFSLNSSPSSSSFLPSSSSSSSLASPGNSQIQPATGFRALRDRVVSDGRLSSHGDESASPEAVSQSMQSPTQAEARRRKSVYRSPFDFPDPPPAVPPRRKLSQP